MDGSGVSGDMLKLVLLVLEKLSGSSCCLRSQKEDGSPFSLRQPCSLPALFPCGRYSQAASWFAVEASAESERVALELGQQTA